MVIGNDIKGNRHGNDGPFPFLLAKSLHALQVVRKIDPSCFRQEETYGHKKNIEH